ncbi:MAG: glycoside hydrolase family 9 protein [Acidobacteriaceae bacterium]|nr:glycoside hydrolase family 9 protein [Acidobacteriaceae bacterium]
MSLLQLAAGASTEIKVDQVGYLPQAPKYAMIVRAGNSPGDSNFVVRRATNNSVAFSGTLTSAILDPDTADEVQTADFSGLKEYGKFYLEIPGVGRSWNFSVAPDVFRRAYYLAMRSYYGQRCGTGVDLGSEFPGYKHGACHLVGAYDSSSGKNGQHVSSYGWHDAGDYGRYVVNSGISTGTLLWTWELYGNTIANASLNLPESGNGVPDILNEVRWNIEWMLTMQDSDGGVWHKQTSAHFSGFVMPEQDKLTSVVVGMGTSPYKSSCATGDFAAVTAIAARAYKPFDAAFSERSLNAAKNAWEWLSKNPNVTFRRNPAGITTGEYGDSQCGDEALWAAAELWRTTSDEQSSTYFLQHYAADLDTISATRPQSWNMVAPLALFAYVLGNGADAAAVNIIRAKTLSAADEIVGRTNHHAYRISLTPHDYIWGSNAVAANYSMDLLIAHRMNPNPLYFEAAMENLHYILGRNTFSLSWVTQVGENAFRHPHHRPSVADNLELPWPGLMAGGPNRGRQDSSMKKLLSPDTPRGKMYVDDWQAYACNEVAINWNAALVFDLRATLPK